MEQRELAVALARSDDVERRKLLARYTARADVGLAWALKDLFYETRVGEPVRAAGAAAALAAISESTDHPEIQALADWINGVAVLEIEGQAEQAIARLDAAALAFTRIGQPHIAAATQVGKLHALAILGRYDEAIACGLNARRVLLAHGDLLTVGKIEQNLGNIYHRRDRYSEAEQFYRAARERFLELGALQQLAQVDNGLANVLTLQHKFRDATQLYQQALAYAEANGMEVTQAEIECNLGCLSLFQGHYDRALDYLERARRRYTLLGLEHKSIIAEQELAEAYLELNLAAEATMIYTRMMPVLDELGRRAEQARALAYHGRACLALGQDEEASRLLDQARQLYVAEGNNIGEAMVRLIEAQLQYVRQSYAAAMEGATEAEIPLLRAGIVGQRLLASWLRAESARALGQTYAAWALLEETLRDAEQHMLPQIAHRCYTSLGLLTATTGSSDEAEGFFLQAIRLIEELRAPLPAEEFRTSFITDKLIPYIELVRLCLADERTERLQEAFGYIERMRSRTLVDILGGALAVQPKPRDSFEAELLARLEELREDLNWCYSQINRLPNSETLRDTTAMADLHATIREREGAILEITRQLHQCGQSPLFHVEPFGVADIQKRLDSETALIEYFELDGVLLAFVVTNTQIVVLRDLGSTKLVETALQQLRFQIDTLRYGNGHLSKHLDQLALRARRHLCVLYDLLLRPILPQLHAHRLVIVPHRMLHYVPFHALCDGSGYVVERYEVSYAPSACTLGHCLDRPRRSLHRAVLLGVADARVPRVHDEVRTLAPLFPEATLLLDDQATFAALRAYAPHTDILHLACHGHFRPDNPLFSALWLGDGWMTARDIYSLDLNCELVVLSACETGRSAVAPGDELIGIARGFFLAGTPSLLVSLWPVDDETTSVFMGEFYTRLCAGHNPTSALREAQCFLLQRHPHPFFWSPFVLLGRW